MVLEEEKQAEQGKKADAEREVAEHSQVIADIDKKTAEESEHEKDN